MSDIRHIFQRLAFELRALGIKEPIEIYVGKDAYDRLEFELQRDMQMICTERYEKGILLYDAVKILLKDALDFDKEQLNTIRKRASTALAKVAKQFERGEF